jgi:hypothetical protein
MDLAENESMLRDLLQRVDNLIVRSTSDWKNIIKGKTG